MTASLLNELGVTARDVFSLGKSDARSVINTLLRWEAWEDAWAVLELFGDDGLVTTMDARARTLVGLGQPAAAVTLLETRLAQRESTTAQVHLARALLAAGEGARAAALLEPLTEPGSSTWWAFAPLADVYLAQGNLARAEEFAHTYRSLSPNSRHPDLILAQVALLRGDRIGASAWATRSVAEGDLEPTPDQLRTLRGLFAAIPDEIRLADTDERLASLRTADLATLRAMLEAIVDTRPVQTRPAQTTQPAKGREPRGRATSPAASAAERPVVTDVEEVPVSDAERAHLEEAARRLFGFTELRPWQPQILAATRRDEDVLAILPTGGGKSLCYQLPAFVAAEEAAAAGKAAPLTLVISPLIALMQDQVQGLPEPLRKRTIALNSAMEGRDLGRALHALDGADYVLVYVAPERLRQRSFIETLRRRGVTRLVIDEAHCVSSWGHNFRPDYLHIARAHNDMGAPPILALTATAPTRVRQDIEAQLFANVRVHGKNSPSARSFRLIAGDSYRANLCLGAEQLPNADEKRARTLELCAALQGPGLIYARSRQACEEIAADLRRTGINADFYHAGLPAPARARVQDEFLANRIDVMVATVAFGMGVDKPDIRFILHHGMPSSLEAYYQEAGRAGRDGKPSTCVLLYTTAEKATMKTLRRQDAITEETLRRVYAEAQRLMQRRNPGSFHLEDLVGALDNRGNENDTAVRVALSALEEAGALQHHYDVPGEVSLRLGMRGDPAYTAALAQSGLPAGEWLAIDYAELCAGLGLDATTAEAQLLAWRVRGFLEMTPQGRKTLVTLVRPAPADIKERVRQVVERFAVLQEQQVEEIFAYARTRRCRHGHLSAALGGNERKKCTTCDNCGAQCVPESQLVPPDAKDVEDLILLAVGRRSIGKRRLARLLRGDSQAGEGDRQSAQFGALRLVSESRLIDAIDAMVADQLLVMEELSSGAVVVKVGPRSARRLRDLDSQW